MNAGEWAMVFGVQARAGRGLELQADECAELARVLPTPATSLGAQAEAPDSTPGGSPGGGTVERTQ